MKYFTIPCSFDFVSDILFLWGWMQITMAIAREVAAVTRLGIEVTIL
jgi:hypothetical protein